MKTKLVVVVGPTASGKTDLAIDIAKEFSGEVISADSRQVYRGLDIGTAKVTETEMRGIPHHLIDVCDIEQVYTAADFKREATAAIEDITKRERVPIIAGGTFFYVDTLLGKIVAPEVAPNPELRAELETKTTTELYEQLRTLDSARAADIDPENPRRLIRAIEIATALGSVPVPDPSESPYETLLIGIETDREELRNRIAARAPNWLENGLKEEVADLLEAGVTRERLQEIGFEYQIALELLDGSLTDQEFIQKFTEKNWQYAKRQLTWLKRDQSIEWFLRKNTEGIFTRVREFLG